MSWVVICVVQGIVVLVVYSLPFKFNVWLNLFKRCNPIVHEEKMDLTVLYVLATVLIVVGIIVVILTVFRSADKSKNAEVKGAGVIMIGPIQIIFGTDKKSLKTVIALALALTIALIILYLFMLR
jgi:uncharacterized protein (TIGR00304 family)